MNTIDAQLLKELFIAGAGALNDRKEYVNELNVFPVPDGDTGTNMTMTIQSAVKEVEAVGDVTMENICKAISSGSLRGARGNSGVILSQLLRGLTKRMRETDEVDITVMSEAFEKAVETAYKAVMKPKEGTILTVARAGAEAAVFLANETLDIVTYAQAVAEHMRYVLSITPEMLPVLKEAGVVDSGGEGLLIVIEGAIALLKEKFPEAGGGKAPDLESLKKNFTSTYDVKKASKASKKEKTSRKEAKENKENMKERPPRKPASKADISTADIKFGYCTEFIIMLEREFYDKDEAEFKIFLEAIGDSIVLVSDDEVVKVHVHTNMPGIAIQKALTYGSLTKMKIDNMREEHNERIRLDAQKEQEQKERDRKAAESVSGGEATDAGKEKNYDEQYEESETAVEAAADDTDGKISGDAVEINEDESLEDNSVYDGDVKQDITDDTAEEDNEAAITPDDDIEESAGDAADSDADNNEEDADSDDESRQSPSGDSGRTEVGFIAVSAGEGLSEIFAGLGADIVIEGGQTMNPSTEDILNAVEQIDADNIFIFPNNSNIILASQQAKFLVEDKNVIVIPSKTIPQGIMALINYMPNKSVEENEQTMMREMRNVKSGSVTYSIRDTVIQDVEIKQGDIMGIGDEGIINTGAQVLATTVELIGELIDGDSELVTLYYGQDTTEDEAELIAANVREAHPEIEVEVHYGGQPVYYYFVSVE